MNIPPTINPKYIRAAEVRHQITYPAIDQIKPNPGNPTTHSPAQLRKPARSMRAHRFARLIVVDPNNVLGAGHGRREAVRQLELTEIPAICTSHLPTELSPR
ncbi:ParB N-terminal domain-containing protein [Bradyrhizobium sp. 6(2017)]|uniref:ParB N-terminal domain-containing protein n=1 Tax=Bradyrhizobium sp. 6(2017) TaxID=1197460 RepID=UPI0013E1A53B|nr:ParB N-terminal domain-containing protein [Bradyrhizobium sp. 6(2017)]QIG91105.1 ParB N-terminal domain-containing protein [Bradyrhizobium sp. 6(2017)]